VFLIALVFAVQFCQPDVGGVGYLGRLEVVFDQRFVVGGRELDGLSLRVCHLSLLGFSALLPQTVREGR